eukprot:gene46531-58019_t
MRNRDSNPADSAAAPPGLDSAASFTAPGALALPSQPSAGAPGTLSRRRELWLLFTLAGIVLGKSIPNLDQLGLEFSIAATFIALITPVVRDVPTVALNGGRAVNATHTLAVGCYCSWPKGS